MCDYCTVKNLGLFFFNPTFGLRRLGHYVGLSFKCVGSFVYVIGLFLTQQYEVSHGLFFSGETSDDFSERSKCSQRPKRLGMDTCYELIKQQL